jgi:hypothetical protein
VSILLHLGQQRGFPTFTTLLAQTVQGSHRSWSGRMVWVTGGGCGRALRIDMGWLVIGPPGWRCSLSLERAVALLDVFTPRWKKRRRG